MFRWERFLTKRQTPGWTAAASNAPTNNSVSQASDALLAGMTPSEIQSHRDELSSLLFDDAIAFLKQRGSKAKPINGPPETRQDANAPRVRTNVDQARFISRVHCYGLAEYTFVLFWKIK
mmetsp:Transcript_50571/g.60838  ORF Transcript_50571/g.60838 Transcript_50571/m.60838 type:complete len:120 (-) Transcript_50571:336-695(-)